MDLDKLKIDPLKNAQLSDYYVTGLELITAIDDIDNRLSSIDINDQYEYSWYDIAKILMYIIIYFGGSASDDATIFKIITTAQSIANDENQFFFIQKPMQFNKNRNAIYYGR